MLSIIEKKRKKIAEALKKVVEKKASRGKTMTGQPLDPIEENPPMSTKEGIGIKSTTT